MPFVDRVDAGKQLARHLFHLRGPDVVVLALPRGGVPVAVEVARALGAPLDVIVVRKLGVPFQPELAMGAIGEDGVRVLNAEVLRSCGIGEDELTAVERRERAELQRRADVFRSGRKRESLRGRTAVIVDDGIATGSTARAACRVARAQGASRVVLAVPVAPAESAAALHHDADDFVCVETHELFFAVGQWYDAFPQISDAEVIQMLSSAKPGGGADSAQAARDDDVRVPVGDSVLAGRLTIPPGAGGIVLFAHGSGSSRHSPRNRYVAAVLNDAGIGTLLFDLLTLDEERQRAKVFAIDLLAARLVEVTRWLREQPQAKAAHTGYFGASTGAAAALVAAARLKGEISAVVSRGGRPDLAGAALPEVVAPTLLIVGGRDDVVLELNRDAQAQLRCDNDLRVVPGATHLFEEPGALEMVADLARQWFVDHLLGAPASDRAAADRSGRRS